MERLQIGEVFVLDKDLQQSPLTKEKMYFRKTKQHRYQNDVFTTWAMFATC